jgi:hypothetical protein
MVQDILIKLVAGTYVLAVRFKKIKQDRRIERAAARGDHRLEIKRGEAAKGGSDWSYIGDAPGNALSPFMWYQRLMRFYSGPRPAETPFFMAKDRVRPYTYSAGLKDLQVMLKRVSPDDTDFALHGIRVEGWNRAAADNAALAEAHGGWKPGNASRYSRFQLADVFTIFPKMVSSGPTDVPMVACWPAEDTPSDDGLAEEGEDVEDEGEDDEDDEGDGDDGAEAMPQPGVPPTGPGGATVTVYTDDLAITGTPAAVATQLADVRAGVAALPLLGQPVVAPVESEADGYVGAAIRMAILNTRASTFLSPTSRALARLRRELE